MGDQRGEFRFDLLADLQRQLQRRDFLKLAAAVGGSGLLAACRRESVPRETAPGAQRPPIEEEPGDLRVFEWSGYEIKPLWREYAQRFPDQEPKFSFLTSSPQALAKMRAGFSPDLVHPCSSFVRLFKDAGLIQPFDPSLLSHFSEISPSFSEAGRIDGDLYMVPLDWGFIAPMYRADHVEPEEESWSLLFDDRYEGRISWEDHVWMLVIAGYFHGFANPWDMSDSELTTARDFLIEKKRLVRNMWVSSTDMINDFAAGNVWIAYAWQDAWVEVKDKGIDVVYPDPKEGRIAWVCGLCLGAETENYHHAHAFADAWASPDVAEWLITNWAYGHANTSIDFSEIDQTLVDAFSLDDPSVLEERAHVEQFLPRQDIYQRTWDEVKAA